MLRLDHFLAPGGGSRHPSWPRRLLRACGRTVEMAPARRAIQAASLLVFVGLAFWASWPYDARPAAGAVGWPSHYADNLARKAWLPVDGFLAIDPLVALSAAIADRSWVWSLVSAAAILAVCVLAPRGFCGYLCPLGTVIDLFDGLVGRRVARFRMAEVGRWRHLRYLLLAACLAAALAGVMLAGVAAAIPVLTRGLAFAIDPLVLAIAKGPHAVPPANAGHVLSLALFAGVLALGLLRPRFWCRHVCPSGAVFSLASAARGVERQVTEACIGCGRCREVCPFDAIEADWSTRADACSVCQTCGGACTVQAITFAGRGARIAAKAPDPLASQPQVSRRALLSAGLVGGLAAIGVREASPPTGAEAAVPVLRPPGSVPEPSFLDLCIRCEACLKVCPNNVLQPLGFARGFDGLWTPAVEPAWAGCDPSCNACGHACPTGAIRALPLDEKRHARIGLAEVDAGACLPWAGREDCRLCVDECRAAGYDAIEFRQAHAEVAEDGSRIAGTGFAAPAVDAAKCVGCGLCQTRCTVINLRQRGVLTASAIVIKAGEGREDRLATGSYRALRQAEADATRRRQVEQQRAAEKALGDFY